MLVAGVDLSTILKLIGHKRHAFNLSEEAAQGAAGRITVGPKPVANQPSGGARPDGP